MQIAILEENHAYEDIISTYLEQIFSVNRLQLDYVFFENVNQFLFELQKQHWRIIITINKPINLIYEIKNKSHESKIIFISLTDKFALEGYRAGVSYYLLYPLNFKEFQLVINECLKHFIKNNEYIIVSSNWQKTPIFLKEILFAEKSGHNIIIHTKNKIISTRMTFKDFLEKIKKSPNIVNCIRGVVVNLLWVSNLESQNFLMKTGERIPIRRQDRKKIKQIYTQFLINNKN